MEMTQEMWIALAVIAVLVYYIIYGRPKKPGKKPVEEPEELAAEKTYRVPDSFKAKQYLLEGEYWDFYLKLAAITDTLNLNINCCVPMTAVVSPENNAGLFDICFKSVDFVITDANGKILLCMDLVKSRNLTMRIDAAKTRNRIYNLNDVRTRYIMVDYEAVSKNPGLLDAVIRYNIFVAGSAEVNLNLDDYYEYDKRRFKKQDYLISINERDFYRVLKGVIDVYNQGRKNKAHIFCQVGIQYIADCVIKGRKVSKLSVDYVISSRGTKISCCIELDDRSHEEPGRQQNDEIKNRVFCETKIPFIRYRAKANGAYASEDAEEIKKQLLPYLND